MINQAKGPLHTAREARATAPLQTRALTSSMTSSGVFSFQDGPQSLMAAPALIDLQSVAIRLVDVGRQKLGFRTSPYNPE